MLFRREMKIGSLFDKGLTLLKALPRLMVVKHPMAILWNYLRLQSPHVIELRSGHRIYLSSHPHDIVSFFVVFIKRDYGAVLKDEVVFDVGANIGCFSVFAALSGAKAVYAFEPSREAFQMLCKNIAANGLDEIIMPVNKAVSDSGGELVKFPSKASPYNSLAMGADFDGDFHEVPTITLEDFMAEQGVRGIDFLKMDCEGAEFTIVPSLSEKVVDSVSKIRMECHGSATLLIDSFRYPSFKVEQLIGQSLWLVNRGLQRNRRVPS